jgi:hypothetical protein
MAQKDETRGELVVFSLVKSAVCTECGLELEPHDFMKLEDQKPLCMDCADLGALLYLPSGNTALTRRARLHSKLSPIVLRFSRTRKRYERQGVLVEAAALEQAEIDCAADEGERAEARKKAAVSREKLDVKFVTGFAEAVAKRYPGCPNDQAQLIAEHACQKHSGRVGRSAAAKQFESNAVDLAVRAHIRHVHTRYDDLLQKGWDRNEARSKVISEVDKVAAKWQSGK